MLVVLASVSAMGMGVVGAQENTIDGLENETIENDSAVALENQALIEFTEDTRIVGWEFRDGRVTVALETDRRTGVVVTDALAGIGADGAVQVPETRQFLERDDTTTVTMDVTEFRGGHSVGVSVDGATVRLSSEMDPDENPFEYFGGEQGLFFGMFMSVVMSGGAAGFVLWREETGVMKA
ncbi:hypothetical protein EA462_15420 [Natrarchaeobius halalkaliphilus]|uniref:Uncharacterized protein n=1 Tax=Natrarchaeobius halalkaliphilus TaxID=1679091 RepID=A0A3N6MSC6_9EURY|nr:hypothetical protein EA462_15420 [Natrarchaeobius halalkaliphilus]